MIGNRFIVVLEVLLRFAMTNEFTGKIPSLMNQLVETVLAIGSGLSEYNRAALIVDELVGGNGDQLSI